MRRRAPRLPGWAAPLLTAALAACSMRAPAPEVYQHETFSPTDTYSHDYQAPAAATCEAARRALLSQGYVIGQANADLVKGRKSFQPKNNSHVQIEFHVVCAPSIQENREDRGGTTVFVSAVQDRYALKKVNNSASLGVGAIGSVSLPFTGSDDSLVKVASETIPAGQFYDRFFALIERYLVLDAADSETAPGAAPAPPKAE